MGFRVVSDDATLNAWTQPNSSIAGFAYYIIQLQSAKALLKSSNFPKTYAHLFVYLSIFY